MSEKPVRPWDLYNQNMKRVPSKVLIDRLKICEDCPFYRHSFKQCKKCGCIMPQKAKLADAYCPVHKWGKFEE